MKITMDKQMTTLAQAAKIRQDMKDFKSAYTDGDLLRAYNDATSNYLSGEVLQAVVEAFPENTYDTDAEARYMVKLFVYDWNEMYQVDYFCDRWLNVNTADNIICGHRTFRRVD